MFFIVNGVHLQFNSAQLIVTAWRQFSGLSHKFAFSYKWLFYPFFELPTHLDFGKVIVNHIQLLDNKAPYLVFFCADFVASGIFVFLQLFKLMCKGLLNSWIKTWTNSYFWLW